MTSLLRICPLLFLTACTTVGYRRVHQEQPQVTSSTATEAGTSTNESGDNAGPVSAKHPVILIIADGLRRDVLEDYLSELKLAEYSPEWHSGLAFLGDEGFDLVTASSAESVLPATALPAFASLLTGTYDHGLPATRFFAQNSQGPMQFYDFASPLTLSRVYYDLGQTHPQNTSKSAAPLAAQLLTQPTLFERLGKAKTSTAVFTPFFTGATVSFLAEKPSADILSLTPGKVASSVVPMVNRSVRGAAFRTLTQDNIPDLTVLTFREPKLTTCQPYSQWCSGLPNDLAVLQREALKSLDHELWKILKAYSKAHEQSFADTTILFVGTAGVTETKGGQAYSEDVLMQQVFHAVEEPCQSTLVEAYQSGNIAVAMSGASAQLYVRRAPLGLKPLEYRQRNCLAQAAKSYDSSSADGIFALAAYQTVDSTTYSFNWNHALEKSLSSARKQRVIDKFARFQTLDQGGRYGDLILFLQTPHRFAAEDDQAMALQGDLNNATMSIPFMVVSRHFPQYLHSAFKATPIELTDITPTILKLLDSPEETFQGLDRAPLFHFDEQGNLSLTTAKRLVGERQPSTESEFDWSESDTEWSVRFSEDINLWSPDLLSISIGSEKATWDARSEGFDTANCGLTEGGGRRTWHCNFPVQDAEGLIPVVIRREPAPDDTPFQEITRTVIHASSEAPTLQAKPTVTCVSDESVKVQLQASAPAGFERAQLFVTDRWSSTLSLQTPGGLTTDTPLSTSELSGEFEFSLPASYVEHALVVGASTHQATLTDAYAETAESTLTSAKAPRSALVGLRLCDNMSRCIVTPLMSARDHQQRRDQGCR